MNPWLAVFLGGGAGSVVRFAISQLFQRIEVKGAFPWATLSANLLATAFLAPLGKVVSATVPPRVAPRFVLLRYHIALYRPLKAGLKRF